MKRLFFHLWVSLLTFAIGFTAVWKTELLLETAQPTKPLTVNTNIEPSETSIDYQKKRFIPIANFCGFVGYSQHFITDDGQSLIQGESGFESRKKAQASFRKTVAKAVRVIEHRLENRTQNGKIGERVVLINPPDSEGNETVSILWYGSGQSIGFITAESLDLAFEFEQLLKSQTSLPKF